MKSFFKTYDEIDQIADETFEQRLENNETLRRMVESINVRITKAIQFSKDSFVFDLELFAEEEGEDIDVVVALFEVVKGRLEREIYYVNVPDEYWAKENPTKFEISWL